MKKLMATAFVVVPVALSSIVFASTSSSSSSRTARSSVKKLTIPELRAQCEKLRGNGQVREFEIHGYCHGSYTKWEKTSGDKELPNRISLTAQTSYTKDMDPLHTPGVSVDKEDASSSLECGIYTKYLYETNSVLLSVKDCSEIEEASLMQKCEEKIDEQIADAKISEGKKVDSIDMCKVYSSR
ncbi:MAG: hypothetical protein OXT67_06445 [Zetaproteobacteria bacterium]|nr:hypothetical protein [Zetaproteobacteria bacterium]